MQPAGLVGVLVADGHVLETYCVLGTVSTLLVMASAGPFCKEWGLLGGWVNLPPDW